jgi:hypothetical protein
LKRNPSPKRLGTAAAQTIGPTNFLALKPILLRRTVALTVSFYPLCRLWTNLLPVVTYSITFNSEPRQPPDIMGELLSIRKRLKNWRNLGFGEAKLIKILNFRLRQQYPDLFWTIVPSFISFELYITLLSIWLAAGHDKIAD